MRCLALTLVLIAAQGSFLAAADAVADNGRTGQITGAVTAAGGNLARTLVYLDDDPDLAPPPAEGERPQIVQRGKAFSPDLLAIVQGTIVEFPNFDPFSHNVFSRSRAASFDLDRYGQGQSKSYQFNTAGVVQIFCNIHPQMRSVVVVVPNAHFTWADEKGAFRLSGVPAGERTVVAWHERAGQARQAVQVATAATIPVQLVLQSEGSREESPARVARPYSSGVERGLGVKREKLNLPRVEGLHPAPSSPGKK